MLDSVQHAHGGHLGSPLSLTPLLHLLYRYILRIDPKNPTHGSRDRFILSCGHVSIAQYVQLYLAGFPLTIDDLKTFRTINSKAHGHPEYNPHIGIETTTGPLGQGMATAVGIAMAQKYIYYRQKNANLQKYIPNVYALVSDGCIQEGISHESSSLAGRLLLDNLIVIYDSNSMSIDGDTRFAELDDVKKRYLSYGWNVREVVSSCTNLPAASTLEAQTDTVKKTIKHINLATVKDLNKIYRAITLAQKADRPTLIIYKTTIGYPVPKLLGSKDIHAGVLGERELRLTKALLDLEDKPDFYTPQKILSFTRSAHKRPGVSAFSAMQQESLRYIGNEPKLERCLKRTLDEITQLTTECSPRKASSIALNTFAQEFSELFGGSADLTKATGIVIDGTNSFGPASIATSQTFSYCGRLIHFGVREHAMAAILNGIAHSNLIPFGSTYLAFSDYMRPAIRLAALMNQFVIYIFTHDSFYLGADGPTHHPVETIASLRSIPNLCVIRPADGVETAHAWFTCMRKPFGPVALILAKQKLPFLTRWKDITPNYGNKVTFGAYILADFHTSPPDNRKIIILASGSEVALTLDARNILSNMNISARVVSVPCMEWFDSQSDEYKDSILPNGVPRVSVEAGVSQSWHKYVGLTGACVSVEGFGKSATPSELAQHFNMNTKAVVDACLHILGRNSNSS